MVYKSPVFIKQKVPSKSSLTSINTTNNDSDNRAYKISDNHKDVQNPILESSIFNNIELITNVCINSCPSVENIPNRRYNLYHAPHEAISKSGSTSESLPASSNDTDKTSSGNFVSKTKTPLSQTPSSFTLSSPTNRPVDVEHPLIDSCQLSPMNKTDDNLTNSESDLLSNYKELSQNTTSLLYLNERFSSAFIDDDSNYTCNNNLMKIMILNKTNLDTTSDERTITNSISLNTYSQDFSIDKIFQPPNLNEQLSRTSWISSTSSSSSQDRQIPQHLLMAIECKRNTSSDSDVITTTTTTTLTTSTIYGG